MTGENPVPRAVKARRGETAWAGLEGAQKTSARLPRFVTPCLHTMNMLAKASTVLYFCEVQTCKFRNLRCSRQDSDHPLGMP
jgi:hypothetical protein